MCLEAQHGTVTHTLAIYGEGQARRGLMERGRKREGGEAMPGREGHTPPAINTVQQNIARHRPGGMGGRIAATIQHLRCMAESLLSLLSAIVFHEISDRPDFRKAFLS